MYAYKKDHFIPFKKGGKFQIYVQREIPTSPILFKFTNQIKEIKKCIVMLANQLLLTTIRNLKETEHHSNRNAVYDANKRKNSRFQSNIYAWSYDCLLSR